MNRIAIIKIKYIVKGLFWAIKVAINMGYNK